MISDPISAPKSDQRSRFCSQVRRLPSVLPPGPSATISRLCFQVHQLGSDSSFSTAIELSNQRGNFRCTDQSVGVENQLQNLASITQILDPKLHQHLETLGGGDYLFTFRMFMALFRREFSFCDSLYLWEMMWALEYDPDFFSMYEDPESFNEKSDGSKGKEKSIRQFGKYEQENMKNGARAEAPLPISVFLVASVLKDRSDKLLQEARGLDDVVKQILNDIAGNIDAKKACSSAMKLQKKYLKKAKNPLI